MNQNLTFEVPTHVMARMVGAELVLLDLSGGTYFRLDPVGTCLWQHLEEGKSSVQARDAMLSTFDVSPEVLERDILELLHELQSNKLLNECRN